MVGIKVLTNGVWRSLPIFIIISYAVDIHQIRLVEANLLDDRVTGFHGKLVSRKTETSR